MTALLIVVPRCHRSICSLITVIIGKMLGCPRTPTPKKIFAFPPLKEKLKSGELGPKGRIDTAIEMQKTKERLVTDINTRLGAKQKLAVRQLSMTDLSPDLKPFMTANNDHKSPFIAT